MLSLLLIDFASSVETYRPFGDCGTAGEWGEAMVASTKKREELEGDPTSPTSLM
jgi:hypothetical protein